MIQALAIKKKGGKILPKDIILHKERHEYHFNKDEHFEEIVILTKAEFQKLKNKL